MKNKKKHFYGEKFHFQRNHAHTCFQSFFYEYAKNRIKLHIMLLNDFLFSLVYYQYTSMSINNGSHHFFHCILFYSMNILEIIELYTLNGCIVCYVNYISIKLWFFLKSELTLYPLTSRRESSKVICVLYDSKLKCDYMFVWNFFRRIYTRLSTLRGRKEGVRDSGRLLTFILYIFEFFSLFNWTYRAMYLKNLWNWKRK